MGEPAGQPQTVALRASDIHYEVALDPEPEPGPPLLVQPPPPQPDATALLPVIPKHLQGREKIVAHVKRQAVIARHKSLYHLVRVPRYAFLVLIYSVAGLFKLAHRQVRWWWVAEAAPLRHAAVASGDDRAWKGLHKESKETRLTRGLWLLGEVAAVAAVLGAAWWFWTPGCFLLVLAAAFPLAHFGRPADKPIISNAVVTPRYRRLTPDIVLRAYYAAGLGRGDKDDQQVTFGSVMSRDGEGSQVLIDLPYGTGLDDAMKAKPKIASGLDVQVSQVFLHRDPTSHRRHLLWVADRDPLAVPVGRTPLLACKPCDIWKAAPLGLDERGQLVALPMMWVSILVSALPRSGKTFAARSLALFAALDPYCRLDVFDFKGSPDWRKFALVADRCAFGLTVSRHGDPLQIFGDTLEALKADVQQRYHRLSELDPKVCPEGKLTREIARDPRYGMPVRVLVMDEFQEVYDLGDASKEVASLLTFLVKVAPGAGVILVGSTQRPSGVGTGQVAQQFTSFRDNFAVRFGLRTSSWQVSELCLGAGAYSEGLDTSMLLPQYKGVGILRGVSDVSPTVRTFLADGRDAERVLLAARALRERAGTLGGMALDEALPERVSVLADVLAVMGDVAAMHWESVAPLLAQKFPERHGTCTAESVSAQCRAAGVPSVDVKQQGRSRMGCRREHVMSALAAGGRS